MLSGLKDEFLKDFNTKVMENKLTTERDQATSYEDGKYQPSGISLEYDMQFDSE